MISGTQMFGGETDLPDSGEYGRFTWELSHYQGVMFIRVMEYGNLAAYFFEPFMRERVQRFITVEGFES